MTARLGAWLALSIGLAALVACQVAQAIADRRSSDVFDQGTGWFLFHELCGSAIFITLAGLAVLMATRKKAR
jgi:hypothetical protein